MHPDDLEVVLLVDPEHQRPANRIGEGADGLPQRRRHSTLRPLDLARRVIGAQYSQRLHQVQYIVFVHATHLNAAGPAGLQ